MKNLSKTFGKLTIPLLVLLSICFSATPAYAKYGGGTGGLNDPYLILDANQMNAIGADSNDWDKHFLLCADIDLSGFTGDEFNIIGNYYGNPFTGVFDGNGHTISNFSSISPGRLDIGLFGYVFGENAEIKDLGLIDPNIDAGIGYYVGSLVGVLNGGTITNCYAEGGSIAAGGGYAGMENGVGGLVGRNGGPYSGPGEPSTISNCYATVSVSGSERSVGGLVGHNGLFSAIINCYSTGSVSGDYLWLVGGLVGGEYRDSGVVSASFWDIETSGQLGSAGGTGKTTAEMQDPNTFMDAGWDFVDAPDGPSDVWAVPVGGGYPILWWQLSPPPELPTFSGGSGTTDDPYLISTPNELNSIGHNPRLMESHFKLINDIDLTGVNFFIIGNWTCPFSSVFDGNGHTISNFTYTSTGTSYIGLFGYVRGEDAEIKNLGLIEPNVDAGAYVGSLVGRLSDGTITNCYVEGGSVSGVVEVGGLVGGNWQGKITNCYSTASVTGYWYVGGLVGWNEEGTITNCYSEGSVSGTMQIGGLVGRNGRWSGTEGTITDCYATGSVSGSGSVGGLVGENEGGTTTNSYSSGDVSGNDRVGGLVGQNGWCYSWGCRPGTVSTCYSTGSVSGNNNVGGLVGDNRWGMISASFWDIETSGQTNSDGGTGLTTAEMQMSSTFTDAGWDFTTPVWTIDEGLDYPRLWWELAPVLHAEPEITLGTTNTISWDPVPGAVDYYAEGAEDANFTSIIYNTGWITEISYEFTGLELGQRYWYSVKARNSAGTETNWSNVESSLQGTLADAVDMMLDPDTLKNKNMKNALINKINAVQQLLDAGRYEEALNKLQNDILQKMNGCAETGRPDKNDWIITCEGQSVLYPLVIETIENVKGLMQ